MKAPAATPYDEECIQTWKEGRYSHLNEMVSELNAKNLFVDKIEVSGETFFNFREMGASVVEFSGVRECKKGLFGRIYNSTEIWINNKLRYGQIKFFATKFEDKKEEKKAA